MTSIRFLEAFLYPLRSPRLFLSAGLRVWLPTLQSNLAVVAGMGCLFGGTMLTHSTRSQWVDSGHPWLALGLLALALLLFGLGVYLGLRATFRCLDYLLLVLQESAAGGKLPAPGPVRVGLVVRWLVLSVGMMIPSLVVGGLGFWGAFRSLGAATLSTSDWAASFWVLLGSGLALLTLAVELAVAVVSGLLGNLALLRLATTGRLRSALNLLGVWRDLRQAWPDYLLIYLASVLPALVLNLVGLFLGNLNVLLIPVVWLMSWPLTFYLALLQLNLLGQYHRAFLVDRTTRKAGPVVHRGCLAPLLALMGLGLGGLFVTSTVLAFGLCLANPDFVPRWRPPQPVRNYQPRPAKSALAASVFAEVDRHALAAPASVEGDLESLAAYLARGASNDREKARAIFRWITDRINYDSLSLKTGIHPDSSPENALRTRLVVCDGFSRLFEALGTRMGLEVEYVVGHVKSGDGDPFDGPGHAWNAVKVDGRWQLLDATWGGGSLDPKTGAAEKQFRDYYFLTPPERLISTHLPEEERWQNLDHPITKEEFLASPALREPFFEADLQLVSHSPSRIVLKGPPDLVVMAQLGESEDDRSTMVSRRGGEYTVDISPTVVGNQSLWIFAGHGRDRQLAAALEMPIRATAAGPALPEVAPIFVEQEVELVAPRSGRLPADTVTHFDLRIPGARAAYVKCGGEKIVLHRSGYDRFVGDVKLSGGTATVYAGMGDYFDYAEGLVQYEVE